MRYTMPAMVAPNEITRPTERTLQPIRRGTCVQYLFIHIEVRDTHARGFVGFYE